MRKFARLVLALLFALPFVLKSQTFHGYGGLIPNNTTGNCFSMTVSGVGNIDLNSGLVRVCLSIDQARPADMDVTLQAPDGTVVLLTSDNGGTSGNDYYEGLCFSQCGPSGDITLGSNFRGVYTPEGDLDDFNTGVSGDGVWQLCIDDDNLSGTDGNLNYWSLSFGSTAVPAYPTGETCATAFALTNLPYSHTCTSLAPYTDDYSACTGNMEGAEFLYSYTPADSGEFLSIDVAQDFFAPSGFPTILLLDTCPDLAVAQNCIQHEIQFNSSENILHITSVPMVRGKTYYIVISSSSGTGGIYDVRIASGENGNDDCLNATVIQEHTEYAGNNYNATIPSLQAPSTAEMTCNGSIDNFVFYTFTTDAIGSTVYVNVTDIDCDIACGGSCGIQLALYEVPAGGACLGPGTWGPPVYCESSTETNEYYAWAGLSPNTQYYLMVDGNAGSQCVWNLLAMGDFMQPLPVEMVDFSGRPEEQGNELQWDTRQEVNLSHFELLHARTLPHFEVVGMQDAAGDASGKTSYHLLHPTQEEGLHYYQLRSVDLDGTASTSEVVSVWRQAPREMRVWPVPADARLQAALPGNPGGTATLLNLSGQQVRQQEILPGETIGFDVSDLEAGLYLLRVHSTDGQLYQRKVTLLH